MCGCMYNLSEQSQHKLCATQKVRLQTQSKPMCKKYPNAHFLNHLMTLLSCRYSVGMMLLSHTCSVAMIGCKMLLSYMYSDMT